MDDRRNQAWTCAALLLLAGLACGCSGAGGSTAQTGGSGQRSAATGTTGAATSGSSGAGDTNSGGPAVNATAVSNHAEERGLEVWFELPPDVVIERIPMRKVVLHFKNRSQEPLRIYLPQSAPFRAGISTVTFTGGGAPLFEPEPRPHGYVVTEADFPLLAPGEERTFEQPFSLDPMSPGAGTATARRPGFEPGTAVKVSWRYENRITRWQGGAQTLDGPSKKLFDGKDIPFIWTGELRAETSWVAP